jgi:hypothetical protein
MRGQDMFDRDLTTESGNGMSEAEHDFRHHAHILGPNDHSGVHLYPLTACTYVQGLDGTIPDNIRTNSRSDAGPNNGKIIDTDRFGPQRLVLLSGLFSMVFEADSARQTFLARGRITTQGRIAPQSHLPIRWRERALAFIVGGIGSQRLHASII